MKKFFFILLSLGLIFSCKKKDTDAPEIKNLKINEGGSMIYEFAPGESFTVSALFTDNNELAQFKIDIHQDFDGHSHKMMTDPYSEIRIKDISSKSYALNETFSIPDAASSGTYHGTLRVLDADGNTSDARIFYFNVTRDNQPVIVSNLPSSISAGSNLNLDLDISAQGNALLSRYQLKIISTQTGNDLSTSASAQNIAGTPTTWNPFTDGQISIPIPAGLTGQLKFRLRIEDNNKNNTIFEAEIDVN